MYRDSSFHPYVSWITTLQRFSRSSDCPHVTTYIEHRSYCYFPVLTCCDIYRLPCTASFFLTIEYFFNISNLQFFPSRYIVSCLTATLQLSTSLTSSFYFHHVTMFTSSTVQRTTSLASFLLHHSRDNFSHLSYNIKSASFSFQLCTLFSLQFSTSLVLQPSFRLSLHRLVDSSARKCFLCSAAVYQEFSPFAVRGLLL